VKARIKHWLFEDGVPEKVPEPMSVVDAALYPSGFKDPIPYGWYCWVYADDDLEFRTWMAVHCPNADCTYRFNNGDPMHTVHIDDDQENLVFCLMFGIQE